MDSGQSYSLALPSDRASIAAVAPFLHAIAEVHRLGTRRLHDLLVALTEAVNNAMIHGNHLEYEKEVRIDIRTTPTEVLVAVRDQGSGFDPEAVPDPRSPERLLAEGGRGVFLIRHLADNAEFHPTPAGTTVVLTYRLP